MAYKNKLQDARVVVFGATSGIGFAVASLCLAQGAIVTISGSNQARLDNAITRLQSFYPSLSSDRISSHVCDLSDPERLEERLKTLFGTVTNNGANKISHIAFTAGDSFTLPKLSDVTPESYFSMSKVRVLGPLIIAKLLTSGKYMDSSPTNSFTLTGGANTQKPRPNCFFLSTVGSSVQGLMRGLAVDLAPIRVNIVEPGAIDTELLQGLPQVAKDDWKASTLVGALGDPSSTAEAYAYAMRDNFATGSVIETNGGYLLK